MNLIIKETSGQIRELEVTQNMNLDVHLGEQVFFTGATSSDFSLSGDNKDIRLTLVNENGETINISMPELGEHITANDPNDPFSLTTALGVSTTREGDAEIAEIVGNPELEVGEMIDQLKEALAQSLEGVDQDGVVIDEFGVLVGLLGDSEGEGELLSSNQFGVVESRKQEVTPAKERSSRPEDEEEEEEEETEDDDTTETIILPIIEDSETTLTDKKDVEEEETTVTLSAQNTDESAGTIVFTATLSNPVLEGDAPVVVSTTLGDITITEGTTGTLEVINPNTEDVYNDESTLDNVITTVTGGNFEKLTPITTIVTAQINDVDQTTTVSVSTSDVNEDAATVSFIIQTSNAPDTDVTATVEVNGVPYTVTLDASGAGILTIATQDSDVYNDSQSYAAVVTSINGGNFEDVSLDGANATADVTDTADTIDETTVTLSAQNTDESAGTVVFTATLSNPVLEGDAPVVVSTTLGDITITEGTTGTLEVINPNTEDVYNDESTLDNVITTVTGGNFEQLTPITTTVTATITDVDQTTNLTLNIENVQTSLLSESFENRASAAGDENHGNWYIENGDNNTNIFTGDSGAQWTVNNAGLEIQSGIVATSTDGTNHAELDPHGDGNSKISTTLDTSGQDSITITFDYNPRQDNSSSNMKFTIDGTEYEISHDGTVLPENSDLIIGMESNTGWFTVTGEFPVSSDTVAISFEGLGTANTLGALLDNIDVIGTATTASQFQLTENGGEVTYVLELDKTPQTDVLVTLSNGQDVLIKAGETSVEFTVIIAEEMYEDVYHEDDSVLNLNIVSASGGNFENLLVDNTSVLINIIDTQNKTTITLNDTLLNEDATVATYSVSVNNAPQETPLNVILNQVDSSNRPIIVTIAVGEITGTVTANINLIEHSDDNISISITETTGGNYESIDTSSTSTLNITAVADTPINVSINIDTSGEVIDSNVNLVINGSFEDTTTNATHETGRNTLVEGSRGWTGLSEMNGWTLILDEGATAPVMEVHDAGHAGVGTTDGHNYMDLGETNKSGDNDNDNTQIGQVIDVSNGVVYSMSFDFVDKASIQESGISGDASGELEVYWGGELVGTIEGDNRDWQTETLELIGGAGDGSNLLSFKEVGEGSDNWGMAIDNVYMAPLENMIEYDLNATASLIDRDDSETLSLELSGLPLGVTLSVGYVGVTEGTWIIETDGKDIDLIDVKMYVPVGSGEFSVTAKAIAVELNGDIATASVTSIVEDNIPETMNETVIMGIDNVTVTQDTNIIIVLDLSGSMGRDGDLDTVGIQSRLSIAKGAIEEMIEAYDGLGEVNIKLTTFSSTSSASVWMSADDAITTINNLRSGGWTNYEDAVYETYNNFEQPDSDKTIGFFISDGEPTKENIEGTDVRGNIGQDAESGWIDSSYKEAWTGFVNDNLDELNVIGIGNGITNTAYLEKLAEGMNSTVTVNVMMITDVTELEGQITPNINLVEGTLSDNIDYGLDGKGGIISIIVDSTEYSSDTFPQEGIDTNDGGKFTFNFDTGNYTYSTVSTIASDYEEVFKVTVNDSNGDENTLDLTVKVDLNPTSIIIDDIEDTIDFSTITTITTINDDINIIDMNNETDQNVQIELSDIIDITNNDKDLVFVGDDGDVIDFGTSDEWTKLETLTTVDGVDGDFIEYVSNTNSEVSVFIHDSIEVIQTDF